MNLTAKELSESIWQDVVSFFEYKGSNSGCWCMNHRMDPEEVVEGEPAKDLLEEGISDGTINGLLFYDGEKPIGWCAIDKLKSMIGHDCFQKSQPYQETDWSIHCLCLVADYRGKGLETKMLRLAEEFLKSKNATRVEAYPEPNSQQVKPFQSWNTFCGYESDFIESGFVKKDPVDPNYAMLEKKY